MKHLSILLIALSLQCSINAQALWNKQIDEAQKVLCKKDVNNSCITTVSNNVDINLIATNQLIKRVDYWQKYITDEKTFKDNDKSKFLRILLKYVSTFNTETRKKIKTKGYNANLSKELFDDFGKTIDAHLQKISLSNVIANKGVLASKIIANNEYANQMKEYAQGVEDVLVKECIVNPETILGILNKKPTLAMADSLVVIAANYNQDKLYDYAQCNKCPVQEIIKRSPNELVKTLYQMAQMETGRSLTPFLDAISRNEITIDSINKIQGNLHQYYKLLVDTRKRYQQRLQNGENVIAKNNFNKKIEETALIFVKEINELHTKPDNIRFEIINKLNAEELYYTAVFGIDELFTSSFNNGVFKQLVGKLNGLTTDKLLANLGYDNFRKFIKISSGYNKLSQFLKLMPDSSAKVLMTNFVSNLADNESFNNIEDAVDVADAYSGIGNNKDLAAVSDLIVAKTKEFEDLYAYEGNKKGETIYKLLNLIFRSYKDTSIDVSTQLNIAPITKVNYKDLADAKSKVVVKLYFYGDEDKDGQYSYQNFMSIFGDRTKWTVTPNKKLKPDFVEINSVKGNPIQIFANYPYYDDTKKTDPDDTAKLRMSEYMASKTIVPTFVMHRGHSYHVPITLKYMEAYDTAAKLIVLGSCGGYQNLQRVLDICPEAHIVSSKQTGTMHVNDPMLKVLFGTLSTGKDIVWPSMWPVLRTKIAGDKIDLFEEYISPNKNLGMIFYKAYKKQNI